MHSRISFELARQCLIRSRNHAYPLVCRAAAPSALSYSSTSSCWKKKKEEIDPEILAEIQRRDVDTVQMMNTNMSEEEARKMMEEQVAQIEEEEKAKDLRLLSWKPGQRKKELSISYSLEELEADINGVVRWTLLDKRCGALGIKLGMLPLWDEWGERHPCTVVYLDSNLVIGHKTIEKHGYCAAQIGAGERKKKNVKVTILGQFKDLPQVQEHPPYIIREFRITDPANLPDIGTPIHARHFVPGQQVDVAGITKGKGFQGGMKRWNFSGLGASHGVSLAHRSIGSTGACQDPGKVFKGKKMPGHMGVERVTKQNLRVVKVDRGRNLLYIKGAIPGNKGEFVEIRDAVKKPLWGTPKVLEGLDKPPLPTFAYDPEKDGCGLPGLEEFMPIPNLDPFDDSEIAA
jgi:large subunit ribosomal protein L3